MVGKTGTNPHEQEVAHPLFEDPTTARRWHSSAMGVSHQLDRLNSGLRKFPGLDLKSRNF